MENYGLLIVNVALAAVLMGMMLLFKKNPPKKINHIYGYRTSRSMRSQESWELANRHSVDLMVKWSFATTAVQILAYLIWGGVVAIFVASVMYVVLCIGVMISTERLLKRRFDEK
jgi:uncharacterized membrane protein